jgi:hypothetical protein
MCLWTFIYDDIYGFGMKNSLCKILEAGYADRLLHKLFRIAHRMTKNFGNAIPYFVVMHFNLSYQCCASGIFSQILTLLSSRIPDLDPGSNNSNKRGGTRKKIELIHQELQYILPKILSLSSQNYGFGIRDPEKTYPRSRIPDPGLKKASNLGSGSATLDLMEHDCYLLIF